MTSVLSRHNVTHFGEVFTPPNLVNDMLDLVAHECERIDSRFLEPACGNGNFLAEVLRRRLTAVDKKRRRAITLWEQDALLGLACLYGIELLYDNVNACRQRLLKIFENAYRGRFGSRYRQATVNAAGIIVRSNILQGNALAMTTVGDPGFSTHPLLFTEWSLLSGGFLKRRHFEFRKLVGAADGTVGELFDNSTYAIDADHGRTVFIEKPIRDLPLIHYLKLGQEGQGVDDAADRP